MYHTYPYKAQIPVLVDGRYENQTFTSKDDVWKVIDLIIAETKEENQKGSSFNIASSVMAQLPFFTCTNIMLNKNAQKDISRFMYVRQFNVPAYKGSYGDQPKKWIEKSFLLNNLIERQKAKVGKDGR
tara:strand:+ start:5353 stop:5736 length:384 start_codon:yes stop_codon:yes gene_type:complete